MSVLLYHSCVYFSTNSMSIQISLPPAPLTPTLIGKKNTHIQIHTHTGGNEGRFQEYGTRGFFLRFTGGVSAADPGDWACKYRSYFH